MSNNKIDVPNIVIPTAQRIFPELLASSIVGVQPMNVSSGFTFALRSSYSRSYIILVNKYNAKCKIQKNINEDDILSNARILVFDNKEQDLMKIQDDLFDYHTHVYLYKRNKMKRCKEKKIEYFNTFNNFHIVNDWKKALTHIKMVEIL